MLEAQEKAHGASPTSLASIPEDVLTRILCYSAPADIVHLRKTCRSLHVVSTRRIVWLEALRGVMDEHNIFQPTYDLVLMSNDELESAALCPSKLTKLARTLNGTSLQPRSHRVLVNWQNKDEKAHYLQTEEPRDFAEMTHVPGGRFLFTTSDNYGETYVKLWDLGQPGNGQSSIRLVARMKKQASVFIHATVPTPDGAGIRIFAAITTGRSFQTRNEIKVYEIFPLSSSAAFKEIATIDTSGYIRTIAVSANRAICTKSRTAFNPTNPGVVLVWDFVHNVAATFRPSLGLPNEVYLWGNCAILYHSDSLSMWKIPDLQPDIPNFDESMEESLPIWEDKLPFSAPVENSQSMPHHQPGWIPATQRCQYIVVCGTISNPSAAEFLLYKLEGSPTFSQPESSSPSTVPTLHTRATFEHPFIGAIHSFVSCIPQVCDQNLVMTCFLQERMHVLMFPIPEKEEERSSSPAMCKFRIGDAGPDLVEFSAATGRAFLFTSDTGELRIIDYIHPR